MGRIYATREDTGERVLLELECDGCGATIKPHPEISSSGWVKHAVGTTSVGTMEWYYCPECARARGLG